AFSLLISEAKMAFRLLAYLQGECQVILCSSKCLTTMMFVTNLRDAQPGALWSCWNYLPQAR
ncbi:MAG: hypothetical protein NT028_01095, partial [candidate division Zixibacteria bacterium]|nr:hypothetical protein [candidate division Zixibacteria bacterium]